MTNEQLVIRIRTGIDVAENTLQLWQQNRGYIQKIANRYKHFAEEEDLLQEGYLGLCTAIDHYSQEEGIPFITYAGYWIRQRIARYIKSNGTIRLPEFMYNRVYEYKRMVSKWQLTLGRKPTDREIRQYLELSQAQLAQVKKSLEITQIGSLDVPVNEEGDNTMYDLLPSSKNEEEQTIEKIQREQLCTVLWELVDGLNAAQAEVIREKYQNGRTLKDIAKERGISIGAADQQHRKGLSELRRPARSKQLRPFLEDRIYSKALQGNGVGTFNRTWTSSTERVALKNWELEELEYLKKHGCL